MNITVVRKHWNENGVYAHCEICEINLEYAKTNDLDILMRIDYGLSEVIGVCLDKSVKLK